MILLLDNYDSFTYNLYQYISEQCVDIHVVRNDAITCEEIRQMQFDAIIFSPGSGKPKDAGIMEDIIKTFYDQIPMLGICLGHQAIAEVFKGQVVHAKEMKHGEKSLIKQCKPSLLWDTVPVHFEVGRYHSLIVEDLPQVLEVIARSKEGEIMALQHQVYPVFGLQFHPESLLTPYGKTILHNFLKGCGATC